MIHPVDDCIHHWICELPVGSHTNGRCKLCGEERVFDSAKANAEWNSGTYVVKPRNDIDSAVVQLILRSRGSL